MANRAAGKTGRPVRASFQIGLTRGLVLGFGGLVLLAVVAVLALGFSSARQNTLDLLGDKSASTIQLIVDRIDQHLRPVEDQLDHLAHRIDNGEIDLSDDADLGKALAGAFAATPHVRSVVFVRADARMVIALRRDDGVDLRTIDVSAMPEIVGAMRAASGRTALYWGEIVHPETAQGTLVNVRYPIHRAEVYMGTLAATVRPAGARGVIGLGLGRAPERHQRIADELVDGAALGLDATAQHREMLVQKVSGLRRRHGFGLAGEGDDVGEHDGGLARHRRLHRAIAVAHQPMHQVPRNIGL
jgi:hypothetical protein